MTQGNNIFLVRELTLGQFSDFYRIDSERAFAKKKHAADFAETLFNKSRPDRAAYRYELVTLSMMSLDGFYGREVFGTSGRLLLREVFDENGLLEEAFDGFISVSAEEGDVCLLAGNIEAKASVFTNEKICFVADKKVVDGGWEYTIYYLGDDGLLMHMHTTSPCIKMVIEKSSDVHDAVVFLSAALFSKWRSGCVIGDLIASYLSGDVPWFHVPELVALVSNK